MSGYFDATGFNKGQYVALAEPAARTAAGNGPVVASANQVIARLTLDVTAVAGTGPTMTATVQTSHNSTDWVDVGSFAAKTTAGTERKVFSGLDNYVRVTWTVGGTTPSITFAVTGSLV